MAATGPDSKPASIASPRRSTDKQEITHIESANVLFDPNYLARYPLLVGKSDEELEKLNKSVLRKLDWRFLPCVSMMLLMK
jgi:hypothetical protein